MATLTFSAADVESGLASLSSSSLNHDLTTHASIVFSQVAAGLTIAGGDTVTTEWIDLTRFGNVGRIYVVKTGAASAGEALMIYCSHDKTTSVLTPFVSGSGASYTNTSGSTMAIAGIPSARYVRFQYLNGSTAQTNLFVHLALHV